jgi:flagellar basal body rod protein FlgC
MISGIMNSAVSGLMASSTRLNTSANNVANQFSTEGEVYQAQRTEQTARAEGGVSAQATPKDPATVPSAQGELPNVDSAEEVIQQQIASYDFKANLTVLKAADEMAEEVINILA